MAVSSPRQRRRPERGDLTRSKLLAASIDVFGRYGFDGTTTRALSDAAGVNLQAIGYHFQGKEGLYLAAAEHIALSIVNHVAEQRDHVLSALKSLEDLGKPVTEKQARDLLAEILQAMAALFAGEESAAWARFIIREQTESSKAFQRIYRGAMKPLLELIGKLVGILLKEDPASEHVRLRTLSLVGSLMVFRVARAAVETHLGWSAIADRQLKQLRELATELASSVRSHRHRR